MKKDKDVLKDYFSEDNLRLAFERYAFTKGDQKDFSGFNAFKVNLEQNIKDLSVMLINGKYEPELPFKFLLPKKTTGGSRVVTVLQVQDAIVYQCIVDKIASKNFNKIKKNYKLVFSNHLQNHVEDGTEVLSDLEFNPEKRYFFKNWPILYNSYKLHRNKIIDDNEDLYILNTDITFFYDSIQHSILKNKLESDYDVEKQITEILLKCLDTFSGINNTRTPGVSIPQGPQPSALLAELILYGIDNTFIKYANAIDGFLGYTRYVDDIEIFTDNKLSLLNLLSHLDVSLKEIAVGINSAKTYISSCNTKEEKDDQKSMNLFMTFSAHDSGEFSNNNSESDYKELIKHIQNQYPETGSIFDSNENIKIKDLFRDTVNSKLLSTFSNFDKWPEILNKELKELNDKIKMTPYNLFFVKPDFSLEKEFSDQRKEILESEHDIRLRFEVISIIKQSLNPNFYWETEYLDLWLRMIKSFPHLVVPYSFLIKNYYNKNSTLKKRLIKFYKEISHSTFARHKIIDILFTDLKFTFSRTELLKLNQQFLENKKILDEHARMSLYLLIFMHFPSDDQLYQSIIDKISDEKDFLKEWVITKLTSLCIENEDIDSSLDFFKEFDPKKFAKLINYI
jgi:hypothetical protein